LGARIEQGRPRWIPATVFAQRVAMPVESLQHPLSVYDELLSIAS
jgi:hypothetical protein